MVLRASTPTPTPTPTPTAPFPLGKPVPSASTPFVTASHPLPTFEFLTATRARSAKLEEILTTTNIDDAHVLYLETLSMLLPLEAQIVMQSEKTHARIVLLSAAFDQMRSLRFLVLNCVSGDVSTLRDLVLELDAEADCGQAPHATDAAIRARVRVNVQLQKRPSLLTESTSITLGKLITLSHQRRGAPSSLLHRSLLGGMLTLLRGGLLEAVVMPAAPLLSSLTAGLLNGGRRSYSGAFFTARVSAGARVVPVSKTRAPLVNVLASINSDEHAFALTMSDRRPSVEALLRILGSTWMCLVPGYEPLAYVEKHGFYAPLSETDILDIVQNGAMDVANIEKKLPKSVRHDRYRYSELPAQRRRVECMLSRFQMLPDPVVGAGVGARVAAAPETSEEDPRLLARGRLLAAPERPPCLGLVGVEAVVRSEREQEELRRQTVKLAAAKRRKNKHKRRTKVESAPVTPPDACKRLKVIGKGVALRAQRKLVDIDFCKQPF